MRKFVRCGSALGALWAGLLIGYIQSVQAQQGPLGLRPNTTRSSSTGFETGVSGGVYRFTGPDEVRSEFPVDTKLGFVQLHSDFFLTPEFALGARFLVMGDWESEDAVHPGPQTYIQFWGSALTTTWRPWAEPGQLNHLGFVLGYGSFRYVLTAARNDEVQAEEKRNFHGTLGEVYWSKRFARSPALGFRIGLGRFRGSVGQVDTADFNSPPPAGKVSPPLNADTNGYYVFLTLQGGYLP